MSEKPICRAGAVQRDAVPDGARSFLPRAPSQSGAVFSDFVVPSCSRAARASGRTGVGARAAEAMSDPKPVGATPADVPTDRRRGATSSPDVLRDRAMVEIRDLSVTFDTENGPLQAVQSVSLTVQSGEVLGVVGESGSGKTVMASSINGMTRRIRNAQITGEIFYKGRDLVKLPDRELRRVHGAEIGMVFQDPMSSLDPVQRIGRQVAEVLVEHTSLTKSERRRRVIEVLGEVGIPRPEQRVDDYPHELSGGMRQRVMIAIAIACRPSLLIADEPTTALDVTIQAQILRLIKRLQVDYDSGVVLISHDLGVIAEVADRVAVMYAGHIVESGSARDVFYNPQHPYTWALLSSIPSTEGRRARRLPSIEGAPPSMIALPTGCRFQPRCPHAFGRCQELPTLEKRGGPTDSHVDRCWLPDEDRAKLRESVADDDLGEYTRPERRGSTLLEVNHLTKHFAVRKGILQRHVASVHAVDDVSFRVLQGETLAIVGESGCGKTTLGRCLLKLLNPTHGEVVVDGQPVSGLRGRALRARRREMQMVFQDPYGSLNPRRNVRAIVGDPLRIHNMGDSAWQARRIVELLDKVGLREQDADRYPLEFSGGQRQRVGIARGIALHPKLVVADEPVSALDVSIRSQILNLLSDLQDEFDLTYVVISHDMGVVRHVADRVIVMYLGRIVEQSPTADLYDRPIHPYTEALLAAVPIPDPDRNANRTRIILRGEGPSALEPPGGCRFHPRCSYATEVCSAVDPPFTEYGKGRFAACHHPQNLGGRSGRREGL